MVYATITDQPLRTAKGVRTKAQITGEARSIREYYRTHNFHIEVNQKTKEMEMRVTKKEDE